MSGSKLNLWCLSTASKCEIALGDDRIGQNNLNRSDALVKLVLCRVDDTGKVEVIFSRAFGDKKRDKEIFSSFLSLLFVEHSQHPPKDKEEQH